jgi:hypothetical protein
MSRHTTREELAPLGAVDAMVWSGALAPPVIWLGQLTASYALVQHACAARSMLSLHVVSAAAIVLIAALGATAWVAWRRLSSDASEADRLRRARFMALFALGASALFLALAVATAIPNLLMEPCSQT